MRFLLLFLLLLSPFALSAAEPSPAPAKSPQWLIMLRPTPKFQDEKAWTPADNAAVGQHFKRLQQAMAAGQVILAGRTSESLDKTIGLVVFEAPDEATARAFMAADPCVVAGIMSAELRPYAVALLRK